jgi:hypothetical protein
VGLKALKPKGVHYVSALPRSNPLSKCEMHPMIHCQYWKLQKMPLRLLQASVGIIVQAQLSDLIAPLDATAGIHARRELLIGRSIYLMCEQKQMQKALSPKGERSWIISTPLANQTLDIFKPQAHGRGLVGGHAARTAELGNSRCIQIRKSWIGLRLLSSCSRSLNTK